MHREVVKTHKHWIFEVMTDKTSISILDEIIFKKDIVHVIHVIRAYREFGYLSVNLSIRRNKNVR